MSSIYKVFIPTYLYIKQHKITGKLYFGKTTRNPTKYKGSGKHWKSHINKHGKHIETLWYCLYTDEQTIKESALSFSQLWNIVESSEWLNLIEEDGLHGGDTSKSDNYQKYIPLMSEKYKRYKWWNNGIDQIFRPESPNENYIRGRLPFNNIGAQIGANIQSKKIWVNNNSKEMMVIPCEIPNGFKKGRLLEKTFANGKLRHSPKNTKWWTNGEHNKMSSISPGPEWKLGRTINPPNQVRV